MLSDVVVQPVGGVGNRLFQLATGEALAAAHGGRVRLSPSEGADGRSFRLLIGDAIPACRRSTLVRCGVDPPGTSGPLRVALAAVRLLGIAGSRRIGRSDAFARPSPPPRRGPVTVVGHVQHPDHFAAGVARVVERIRANRAATGGPIDGTPSPGTVVHLRRGDYVRLGWALGTAYYRDALEELARRAPGMPREVEIVGDDPMAVGGLAARLEREGWSVDASPERRADGEPADAVREFWRLATARRLVMSNSTFCWWAAVVGDVDAPGRPVAFPSGWIGAGGDQLHRPGWLRIPSTTDGRPTVGAP